MARYRGGARSASKHSGDQYSQGFQYRDPQITDIVLGPWEEIDFTNPIPTDKDPRKCLNGLSSGILRNGEIRPYMRASEAIGGTLPVIGIFEAKVGTTTYALILQKNASDQLVIINNGTTDTFTTIAVTTTGTVRGFQWGDYFYFGSPGIATGLVRYTLSTRAINEPATSHTALYDLFLLDNNAVSIELVSNTWLVSWSVDSSPENWTSAGSGNTTYYDSPYRKAVAYNRYAVLMFGDYAIRMEATGTADPTFMFNKLDQIPGALSRDAVAGIGNYVIYVGMDYRTYALSNDRVVLVSDHTIPYNNSAMLTPRVSLLKGLSVVAIAYDHNATPYGYYINEELKIVGQPHRQWSFAATADGYLYNYAAWASSTLKVHLIQTSPGGSLVSVGQPYFITSMIDLGEDMVIEYIDVFLANQSAPTNMHITLVGRYNDITSSTITTELTSPHINLAFNPRYFINQTFRSFYITNPTGGTWTTLAAITKIVVRVRRQKITSISRG